MIMFNNPKYQRLINDIVTFEEIHVFLQLILELLFEVEIQLKLDITPHYISFEINIFPGNIFIVEFFLWTLPSVVWTFEIIF